jgi:hypothetical protein
MARNYFYDIYSNSYKMGSFLMEFLTASILSEKSNLLRITK